MFLEGQTKDEDVDDEGPHMKCFSGMQLSSESSSSSVKVCRT